MRFTHFLKHLFAAGVLVLLAFLQPSVSSAADCPDCDNLHSAVVNEAESMENRRGNISEFKEQIYDEMTELDNVSDHEPNAALLSEIENLAEAAGCETGGSFGSLNVPFKGMKGKLFDVVFSCPDVDNFEFLLQDFQEPEFQGLLESSLDTPQYNQWQQVQTRLEGLEDDYDDYYEDLDEYFQMLEDWLDCMYGLFDLQAEGQCTDVVPEHDDVSVAEDFDEDDCPDCAEILEDIEALENRVDAVAAEMEQKNEELEDLWSDLEENEDFTEDLEAAVAAAGCDTTADFNEIDVKPGQAAGVVYGVTFHCKSEAAVEDLIKELAEFWQTHVQPVDEESTWDEIFEALAELEALEDEYNELIDEKTTLFEEYMDCLDELYSLHEEGFCNENEHEDDGDEDAPCPDCNELWEEVMTLEDEVDALNADMERKNDELNELFEELDANDAFREDLEAAVAAADCDTVEDFSDIDVQSGQAAGVVYGVTFHCKSEAAVEDLIKELENFWKDHDKPSNDEELWDDIFQKLEELEDLQEELDDVIEEKSEKLEDLFDCLLRLLQDDDCPWPGDGDGPNGEDGSNPPDGGSGNEEEDRPDCPDCEEILKEAQDKAEEIKAKEQEIATVQNELEELGEELDEAEQFEDDLATAIANAGCSTDQAFGAIDVGSGQAAGVFHGVTFYCRSEAAVEDLIRELQKFWETHDQPGDAEAIWDDIFEKLDELEDLQDELNELEREHFELLEDYLDCLWELFILDCPVESPDSFFDIFFDIRGHWAEVYIEALRDAGIVSGDLDGNFHPDRPITRAEAAKIFTLLLELETDDCDETLFSDVEADDWFCVYVTAAAEAGIFTGYPNGMFGPERFINRAEVVAVLLRATAATILDNEGFDPFDDVPGNSWYAAFVHTAKLLGIVNGKTPDLFDPSGDMTRAEFAKVAMKGHWDLKENVK